jgi:hypothetical protein
MTKRKAPEIRQALSAALGAFLREVEKLPPVGLGKRLQR